MSQRNTLEAKRARRLRRSIRKGRLPAQIDLIHWVKLRSHVTSGMARKIILSGALKVDSHEIGVTKVNDKRLLRRYVPSDLNTKIQVVMPKELRDAN